MSQYTVRVELHSATYSDYQILHNEMASRGLGRTIKSHDGGTYDLPTAEYNLDTNLTRDAVLKLAIEAAARTGKQHGILVSEAISRTWYGLKQN